MKKFAGITSLFLALPLVAFAQGTLQPVQVLLVSIGNLVSLAIPILIGVAMIVLIWGIIQYIRKPDDTAKGRQTIIAGIIGLFVIISIWGIIHLAQNALLGGSSSNQIPAPHFPTN